MNVLVIVGVSLIAIGLLVIVFMVFRKPAPARREHVTVAELQARLADEHHLDDEQTQRIVAEEPETPETEAQPTPEQSGGNRPGSTPLAEPASSAAAPTGPESAETPRSERDTPTEKDANQSQPTPRDSGSSNAQPDNSPPLPPLPVRRPGARYPITEPGPTDHPDDPPPTAATRPAAPDTTTPTPGKRRPTSPSRPNSEPEPSTETAPPTESNAPTKSTGPTGTPRRTTPPTATTSTDHPLPSGTTGARAPQQPDPTSTAGPNSTAGSDSTAEPGSAARPNSSAQPGSTAGPAATTRPYSFAGIESTTGPEPVNGSKSAARRTGPAQSGRSRSNREAPVTKPSEPRRTVSATETETSTDSTSTRETKPSGSANRTAPIESPASAGYSSSRKSGKLTTGEPRRTKPPVTATDQPGTAPQRPDQQGATTPRPEDNAVARPETTSVSRLQGTAPPRSEGTAESRPEEPTAPRPQGVSAPRPRTFDNLNPAPDSRPANLLRRIRRRIQNSRIRNN
ncbi:hypothetical protein B0T44_23830 [Nocardia donostiensis]|nr:hypothetical protein B0T44_23830 [Nocardia donostiensis]